MYMSFSYIDKDEKTFDYMRKYFVALDKNDSLFALDLSIQRDELIQHLERVHKIDDQAEMTKWIEENSAGLRCWINSLKILSMFLFFEQKLHKNTITLDLFEQFVDLWNGEKKNVCDTIKMFS